MAPTSNGRGIYSSWWDTHICSNTSQWLRDNLRDMDVKMKQMIGIIEEDADSFAKRAEMYYKRRPELMKLAQDFYRAYRALAERYGHATGVLRHHARRTIKEAFPDKVKLMPENGPDSLKCGDDSDDFPPEMSDHEIAAVMGLPDEFMSVENKPGFDDLDGLFNSLGAGESYFHLCGCHQRAAARAEEAKKEVTAEKEKESETERVQEKRGRLEESDKEADFGIERRKETIMEGGVARETDLLELQKSRERVDVEDSLQKLHDIWFQFQEETMSLFVQLQGKVLLLDDAESCLEFLHEEIRKVQAEGSVLSDQERLQMLEVDTDQLACILEQVCLAGLDPENPVQSIKELNDKLAETKKTLKEERSENAALQEKSALFDEFINKNGLLEVDIFYLEMQLEEFRDKVQFLEESCESLLEERSNEIHEKDSLTSRLQETADQNKKLEEMNCRLETSLSEANSQLRALMMRAKGINDYLQNAERDYDELRSKYSVLEAEKEALTSEITRQQIELKTKEECLEELEKSLDANINDLFPNRDARDIKERNSSLLFKFQTLMEAWKFSQVQISCLEHENLVQQSELQFLSDQIDIGKASLRGMSKSKAVSPEESVESDHDDTKNMIQKVHEWHESLSNIEEEYLESAFEKSVLCSSLVQMRQEAAEVASILNQSKLENLQLRNEIAEVKSENDLLLCEVLCGKDLLCEKEKRILEADKLLKAGAGEEKKVQRKLYNLEMEVASTRLAKEDQDKQISILSEDLNQQIIESGCLQEEIRRMECQLREVNKDYHEICRREQTRAKEFRVCEAQATAIFCELILSGLKEAILEDRVIEVTEANGKEKESMTEENDRLREMVKRLEAENSELRSWVSGFMWGIEKVNPVSEPKDRGCGTVSVADKEVADKMVFYKPSLEICLAQNEFMTKEIVLDQSFVLGVEAEERMLELWETSDTSGNIDLKVGKPPRETRPDDSNFDEEPKLCSIANHCGESQDDMETGPGKQEITESFAEHKQVGSRRRLLERLNADAQKLTNLHITLNDLLRMVELIMRSGLESDREYDTIKAQLDEARATTAKLSQANTKLVKAVEKRFHSRPVKPTSEVPDDGESFIRRRISEKARRGTDKVARLQSETQKLQFLLLRLGEQEEKARAAATRVVDRKPRVLLKDYLNSRSRGSSSSSGHKQKKVQFCACVQLPSRRS